MQSTTQEPRKRADSRLSDLEQLLGKLGHSDGVQRRHAREALVAMGEPAVKPLIEALSDERELVRWEAAKAFTVLRAPQAADALVRRLKDEDFGVRWLAAEAMINLGEAVLPAVFRALMAGSYSVELRAGAHHVLSALNRGELTEAIGPVLTSLRGYEPELTVPLSAEAALHKLSRQGE